MILEKWSEYKNRIGKLPSLKKKKVIHYGCSTCNGWVGTKRQALKHSSNNDLESFHIVEENT